MQILTKWAEPGVDRSECSAIQVPIEQKMISCYPEEIPDSVTPVQYDTQLNKLRTYSTDKEAGFDWNRCELYMFESEPSLPIKSIEHQGFQADSVTDITLLNLRQFLAVLNYSLKNLNTCSD